MVESSFRNDRSRAADYLGRKRMKAPDTFIKAVMDSRAETAMIPMWDILSLGDEGRVNRPGVTGGNWTWRMEKSRASRLIFRADKLHYTAEIKAFELFQPSKTIFEFHGGGDKRFTVAVFAAA